MTSIIRRLTIDDYDDLVRVWAEAGLPFKPQGRDSRERIEEEMQRADSAFFGLAENDRIMAVGLASYDGRKGWIQRVAVNTDCRGRGLGGEIIAACEVFLETRGAEVISCLIEEVNYPSISVFRNSGYEYWKEILYFSKRDSSDS
jgi:ribosomal protein S18 acetylase RimI-like enzyme